MKKLTLKSLEARIAALEEKVFPRPAPPVRRARPSPAQRRQKKMLRNWSDDDLLEYARLLEHETTWSDQEYERFFLLQRKLHGTQVA